MTERTFIRLRENGETSCFSMERRMSCVRLIALMNDALKEPEGSVTIGDVLRRHSGPEAPMSEEAWTEAVELIKRGPCGDRFADINVDGDQATLSDWVLGKERTVISGAISRLTGCYEMSLDSGRLDQERFAENLSHHCGTFTVGPAEDQSMPGMSM